VARALTLWGRSKRYGKYLVKFTDTIALLMLCAVETRCRPNGTKRCWPAMECYRGRQTM